MYAHTRIHTHTSCGILFLSPIDWIDIIPLPFQNNKHVAILLFAKRNVIDLYTIHTKINLKQPNWKFSQIVVGNRLSTEVVAKSGETRRVNVLRNFSFYEKKENIRVENAWPEGFLEE